MKPKITVIIPCYNAEKWIEESIMSALNQTHEDTEVIFVDNESTDASYEIAKKIQQNNSKLQVFTVL